MSSCILRSNAPDTGEGIICIYMHDIPFINDHI